MEEKLLSSHSHFDLEGPEKKQESKTNFRKVSSFFPGTFNVFGLWGPKKQSGQAKVSGKNFFQRLFDEKGMVSKP